MPAPAPCPCASYRRRRPELTALHIIVRQNLETFLATVREERGKDLPRYTVEELRRYARCGILAHGFLRLACSACGHEALVGYSCKCRGACPSCSARRMCDVAAHLVDSVLPDTRTRQWVLTAPYVVRRLMALRPDALTACHRIFVTEIARWQKRSSGLAGAETGCVSFVQRFHAGLGPFVHFHVVQPDGVFTRDEDGVVRFHVGSAPSREDIALVAARVAKRMTRWLRRRKLIDERPVEERSNEAPELSPLEACMQLSLFGGTFLRLDGPEVDADDEHRRGKKSPWVAEVDDFNVHAGVVIHKGDRQGLERLCRYGARPPFSLERISILPDGRVAYLLKKPRRNGATHLVMTPVVFLARIVSIIPPPRFPLQRFAGVFAPGSSWRRDVVAMCPRPATTAAAPTSPDAPRPTPRTKTNHNARNRNGHEAPGSLVLTPRSNLPPTTVSQASPSNLPPTTVSQGNLPPNPPRPRPHTSLGEGLPPPWTGRHDWATLRRRVYLEDVLACPCGGRRTLVADINEPGAIRRILDHLGLPSEPPTIARARDPDEHAA